MTKAAKNAVEPKVSRSLETSAPTTELPGANKTVGNSTPERITTGQSPRKPRLMNILLDKLREQPKPVQASERRLVGVLMDTETDNDFDNDFDAVNDTEKPSTSSASQPEGRNDDPWIGETQIGENSTRSMTFTYPPGSTPLPRYTIRRGVEIGGFGEIVPSSPLGQCNSRKAGPAFAAD